MSLKDLFKNNNIKIVSSGTLERMASDAESVDYIESYLTQQDKMRTVVDFSKPDNFVRFGSAEKYYKDAIGRIQNAYPYDGSRHEQVQFHLSSSDLDKYIFDNEYPRTNGFANFIVSPGMSSAEGTFFYPPHDGESEYILVKGGPNTSTRKKEKDIRDTTGDYKDGYANTFDLSENRENNLKIDGNDGNTIEFWLKKEAFVANQDYFEFVFDAHVDGAQYSDGSYGRLSILLATTGTVGNNDGRPFCVEYASGSTVIKEYLGATSGSKRLTTASIADGQWHHYAIRMKTSGSETHLDLFVDGEHNEFRNNHGDPDVVGYVSGAIVAAVGAQVAPWTNGSSPYVDNAYGSLGWSKFSGSIDELRFWKTWRTAEQIGRQYIEPVGAGANTDDANTDLGVYFKFNEGITETGSVDSTVLDYSGRISNGTWVGYNSTYSRSTESAMVLSEKVDSEFKDPILYSFHPEVKAYTDKKIAIGKEYDYRNPNSMYKSVPSWVTELDNAKADPPLKNLTQILSSYFDTLHNQVENLSKLKHPSYVSGTASGSHKPYFFNNRILQGHGFPYIPDLFKDATFLEFFRARDDRILFEEKLYDIKNTIYNNIYNNLSYINKTKGTEKAFRNMFRCFGVDEEILKIRYYANESEHEFRDNIKATTETRNYANFALTGSSEATIYQYQTDSNTTSYISGSGDATNGLEAQGFGFTLECQAVFPYIKSAADYNTIINSADLSTRRLVNTFTIDKETSIFGMRSADPSLGENNLTVPSNDRAGFIVTSVRDNNFDKKCYFKLMPTNGSSYFPTLTSSYFEDVFDESKWNFAVSVKPTKYGQVDLVSGSEDNNTYDIVFQGVYTVLGETRKQFEISSSVTNAYGKTILTTPKRVFLGAVRQNLTGSLIVARANSAITDCRYWLAPLSSEDIRKHSVDFKNFGVTNPYQSAYNFQSDGYNYHVPNIETIALHWNFSDLTSSDANGNFNVTDYSSGSSGDNRYGPLSNILTRQHSGRGQNFVASSAKSFAEKNVYNSKSDLPEYINSYDMIRISDQDDVTYTKGTRPTNYFMTVEKSMYQTVSEEMLKVFSSMADFGSLVGEQASKYRTENKKLIKLRQMFFENISNTPRLEKYIDYYKWFDTGLNFLLSNLVPATALMHDEDNVIKPVVEEYVFNRNKYISKFPTLELKASDPEGNILAINELLYNWEFGSHPLNSEDNNCLWWKDRAEREDELASGKAGVDSNKQTMLDVINNLNNASAPYLSGSGGSYQGSTYVIRKLSKPLKLTINKENYIHGGANNYENKKSRFWDSINQFGDGQQEAIIQINDNDVEEFRDCNDDLVLNNGKRKYRFTAKSKVGDGDFDSETDLYKGDRVFPFSLYSSSAGGAYRDLIDSGFKSLVDITNLHLDSYGPYNDIAMQGPFTEKFVGGHPHRHVFTNFAPEDDLDDADNRLEGWKLVVGGSAVKLLNPDSGSVAAVRSQYFREEYAKRPVNIKNIRMYTGSALGDDGPLDLTPSRTDQVANATNLGNYMHAYEVVMTNDRSLNNRYLAESDGALPTTYAESTIVSGVMDFAIPRRDLTGSNKFIIANRFSAPGDPATMGEGMLDVAAAEYSVYNALPWRNLSVRLPLNEWHANHANQFGYYSDAFAAAAYDLAGVAYPGGNSEVNPEDYHGTASYHKTNRNGRLKIVDSGSTGVMHVTGVAYDNFFVQHQIPQTDVRYAWITSSIVENYSGSALFGFEKKDFSNASYASSDISFVLQSEIENAVGTKVDFAGLNTIVLDTVDTDSNTLTSSGGEFSNENAPGGTVDDVHILNALNLHRNGPYQWASWQHYRNDENAIVRHARNNNRLSFHYDTPIEDKTPNSAEFVTNLGSDIEPPINSRHLPIAYSVHVNNINEGGGSTSLEFQQSFYNNYVKFSDKVGNGFDLNNSHFMSIPGYDKKVLAYDTLRDMIIDDPTKVIDYINPIIYVEKIRTNEVVFPREKFTYLSTHRQRENFKNNFWRDARTTRTADGSNSPFIIQLGTGLSTTTTLVLTETASIWPLDAGLEFADNGSPGIIEPPDTATAGFSPKTVTSGGSDGAGVLQNNVMPYNQFAGNSNFAMSHYLYPLYNRRVPVSSSLATNKEALGGSAMWETSVQAGKKPFYDTYAQFIEDVKKAGKDFSIIPEFIISDHMDYYINDKKGSFKTPPTNSFSIAGAAIADSAELSFVQQYSHSDFLKTFNMVKKDFVGKEVVGSYPPEGKSAFLGVDKIELECEVMIKFLPYDGFYPAQRTVQLAKLFYEDYKKVISVTGGNRTAPLPDTNLPQTNWASLGGNPGFMSPAVPELNGQDMNGYAGHIRPVWQPLFAPGVLYNSIKSGIAVDYPVHITASDGSPGLGVIVTGTAGAYVDGYPTDIPRLFYNGQNNPFAHRVPFEALVDPFKGFGEGKLLIDQEPHPSASMNLTASISAEGQKTYKLAMHNFLASTIDFFKPNGELTTISSSPDNDYSADPFTGEPKFTFTEGKEYKMRVVLYNGKYGSLAAYTNNVDPTKVATFYDTSYEVQGDSMITMYARTGSTETTGALSSDFYGSSFGPPSLSINNTIFPQATYRNYSSASYEPFTPPYYDGYSHVEYTFRPAHGGQYTIPEIVNELSSSYWRFFTGFSFLRRGPQYGSISVSSLDTAAQAAMQISASINPLQIVQDPTPKVDANGVIIEKGGAGDNPPSRITIQPKWETPVLDFSDVEVTLSTPNAGTATRGMWHQYGALPAAGKGIRLQVQSLQDTELSNPALTGSLASKLGFSTDSMQIGTVAESKEISEAVVAIPYLTDGHSDLVETTQILKGDLFWIDSENNGATIEAAKIALDSGYSSNALEIFLDQNPGIKKPSQALIDMVKLMRKYVIPPQFDFLKDQSLSPFAMFIFEFKTELSQKDLTDIWQNLPPDIGTKVVNLKQSLPVEIFKKGMKDETTLIDGDTDDVFPSNTQWAVFKVKKKSAWNYFDKTAKIEKPDPKMSGFGPGDDLKYNYNWPYDFFSLIELGKINMKAEFAPYIPVTAKEKDPVPLIDPNSIDPKSGGKEPDPFGGSSHDLPNASGQPLPAGVGMDSQLPVDDAIPRNNVNRLGAQATEAYAQPPRSDAQDGGSQSADTQKQRMDKAEARANDLRVQQVMQRADTTTAKPAAPPLPRSHAVPSSNNAPSVPGGIKKVIPAAATKGAKVDPYTLARSSLKNQKSRTKKRKKR